MSSDRFDELTKELANGGTSRRKFLTGLAGAAAGAFIGAGRARAVLPGPGGSTCSNAGQSCAAQQCCQGLNCLTDLTNATEKFCCSQGTPIVCGSKCCPTGAVLGCSAGKCTCPTGEVVCPDANNPLAGRCVNLVEDVNNCGACGVSCGDPIGADAPCRVRACVNGGCTTLPNPAADGVFCEDGNLCTVGDTCNNGTCQSGTPVQCLQCQKCDPDTGGCAPDPDQVGDQCDDGLACTTDDRCTAAGTCVGTPVVCQALDQCHVAGVCQEPGGACTNPIKANGTPCDDGNLCTLNDTCQAGICTGQPRDCNDNDVCTTDTCDPSTGACLNTPIPACCRTTDECPQPANQCQQATCVNNVCGVTNKSNGSTCNDNNPCTTNDVCTNGVCTGTLVVCPAGTTCANGSCVCNANSGCTGCCQTNTCQPGTAQTACGSNGVTCQSCPPMGMAQQICSSQNNNGVFRCCRNTGRPCNTNNPDMCCSKSCPTGTCA
jgi:Dictyostelium (slime mold) repeat